MYREYLAPLDTRLLSVYPQGGLIHLCGSHTQHIPAWREMPKLKCVQMNDSAANEFTVYYENLREDQIIYFRETDKVSFDDVIDKTKGKRVILCGLPRE
jgi:hypothetical protein